VSSDPTFVMAGPDGVVVAEGVETAYPALADALAALAAGHAPIIVGALPFDVTKPTALVRPRQVHFSDALPDRPRAALPAVRVSRTLPAPEVHRARITEALRRLNDPSTGLQKVVLARGLHMVADGPLDAMTVLGRLTDDSIATGFLADLTTAGAEFTGTALIGASPELLVARRGDVITCRPFAGSAPRSPDPDTDRASGAALAESAKNRHEHQLVVDEMLTALAPLCVDVEVAATPDLTGTSAVWHLSTPITARLRESSTTALDLAIALHPTPAVGGVPGDLAADLITELEGDRGFYAGAVGWTTANGDGRWVVSIRCAQLAADRRSADARSGGGIVAESDPDDEVAETTTKFRTIMSALGVES
jgi:isochorismate synthase